MKNKANAIWAGLLDWLENGDLVPVLVLVSAAHYIVVLQGHDWWPVAAAIGLLVDIGHFRSVMIAVRYSGSNRAELVLRYFVAGVMTAVSLSYHWRFYGGDWTFAVPMPLLIAALAYFDNRDKYKRRGPSVATPPPTQPTPEPTEDTAQDAYRHCEPCDFTAYSPQAWAGHCGGAQHKAVGEPSSKT